MIYLSYKQLKEPQDLDRLFVQQWAKYRYGVFDELGYVADPVYPICHQGDSGRSQITGCSDLSIEDTGVCDSTNSLYNVTTLVHPEATSSIMFAATAPQVIRFCDSGTHNRYSPTKHNLVCDRRSTMDVILQHPDFANNIIDEKRVSNTTPVFHYKRRSVTRYVLVIEDTKDMLVRESWSFLRLAMRKWTVNDLPGNTEVGLVLTNETSSSQLHNLSPLTDQNARDLIIANIPFTPGDSHAAACLQCGIHTALQMLKSRATTHGPASSVIVLIAPGMDHSLNINSVLAEASDIRARITTINYPSIVRPRSLDALAAGTGAPAFTVQESKYNVAISLLSTYFKLTNVMFSIATQFYQGSSTGMPIEIHRREITDDGRSTVTGSFVLDESLGEPARFTIFTHSTDNPLIRGISLVSPSQNVYSSRYDFLLIIKLMSLHATINEVSILFINLLSLQTINEVSILFINLLSLQTINETGTWTYTIERFPGNPQPHYVQVMATPRSKVAPVVRARSWTSQGVTPLILYTEVKRGDYPVLGARIEVLVNKPAMNGTNLYRDKFELLDTGSGDPDLTKGDGIYSRYFTPMRGGPGLYTFEIMVTDNSNTAYAWHETILVQSLEAGPPCCGSLVPTPAVQPLSPFQRVLPPISITFTPDDVASQPFVGRIGDLRGEILASELKARLTWTAPDMGGLPVSRYELRFAHSVTDIVDRFETASEVWDYGSPFPLPPGSETVFTMDLTRNPSLLDIPLFVSIRGFADSANNSPGGPISNWVRILVPSPPPPPPPPSTASTSTYDLSSWPLDGAQDETIIPRIAQSMDFGLELILPIVGGIALLMILIVVCYLCMLRRRNGNAVKKQSGKDKHVGNGKQLSSPNASITILLHEHERRHSPYGQTGEDLISNGSHAQLPPPVPPLPAFNHQHSGGYPSGPIYGVHPGTFVNGGYHRNGSMVPFNPSLQGSLSSVSSGDRKKRNVTMV
uniref:Calcium-activated chloride channel N-terminal domain-containing protein n=1 Tax=Timema cristinae TaxID=61476 RepID=A0A7R9CLE7_TIMCR|nr:unnamed protein product [Timema cristinae]